MRDGSVLQNSQLQTFHRAGKLLSSCPVQPAAGNHPPGREKLLCPCSGGKVGSQDDTPEGQEEMESVAHQGTLHCRGWVSWFLPLSPEL